MIRKIISLVAMILFLTSCAQKTAFFSDPSGAQVAINGKVIGETPCTFQYKTSRKKIYEIVVSKENHTPIQKHIVAEETDKKSMAKWMAAGAVWSPLWIGTFFTKKLKDSYHFILAKVEKIGNPSAPTEEEHLENALAFNQHYRSESTAN